MMNNIITSPIPHTIDKIQACPPSKKRIEGLDFLKGIAILWVIVEHSLPNRLYEVLYSFFPLKAVPVFFCITFFLMFRKFSEKDNYFKFHYAGPRFWKMFKKVFIPFFVVLLIQLLVLVAINDFGAIENIIRRGGYGPGSYYPWVYLQMFLIAPILYWVVNMRKQIGIIVLLLICITTNVLLSYIKLDDEIYRLLSIRYFFIAAISYIWMNKDHYNKLVLLVLGFISLVYLVCLPTVNYVNLKPFVYDGGWYSHNYPGYFFTLVMIVALLAFAKENINMKYMNFFKWCGENSWYIFLAQMFIIGFNFNRFGLNTICHNSFVALLFYVPIVLVLTLGSVWVYLQVEKHIKCRKSTSLK